MFNLARIPTYDLYDDFTANMDSLRPRRDQNNGLMSMDMCENEKEFEAVVNVPGIAKDHVKLSLDDRVLTIEADYRNMEEKNEGKYHWKERSQGHVKRSVQLPKTCDVEKISAKQEEGVLKITIPKHTEKEPKQSKSITIN